MNKTIFLLLCMLLVIVPVISESKTIQFPIDYNTIAKAIENAADGDTVSLADGTHMCTETIHIAKGITIKSNGDAKGCTIVFQGSGQFKFTQPGNAFISTLANIKFMKADNTAIYIESASPEFEACTFTQNSGLNGGAVYIKNGQSLFSQCYFSENNAQNGGALYLDENSKVTFNECKIDTNTAVYNGGGLYIHQSEIMFVNTYIYYNTAETESGGGIFMNKSNPSFAVCEIKYNTAGANGGGAFISESSEINTYQCDVINNSCNNGNGGGLYIENSQGIILEAYTIENNSAKNGAGLYITNSKTSEIQQCIFYNNKASYNGAAIYLKDSESTKLVNLLVSENDADLDAGGFYFENCNTGSKIIFCTFTRNSSKSSMDTGIVYFNKTSASIVNSILWNDGYNEIESINIDPSSVSVTYSDVQMAYTNIVYDGDGNINNDPIFENDSKQDDRYLHLDDLNSDSKSSPCINSGKLDDSLPQVDLYHVNRTKHGKSADMGAIEYVTRGAELVATPEFGRDPLSVDLDCRAGEDKPYTYSIDFGDGSEIMENADGSFFHRYSGGLFHPVCTIILKQNPSIYSIPDSVTINVASFHWRFDTGGIIESSPAIGHDGSIYVGSDSGAMFGVNPDGTKKWQFQTGGRIVSSPSVYSNTVIFGSEDKCVYKVNAETGQKIWRFDTFGEIYSSPAIDKSGNIYIGSCDGRLYAITPDGQKKWSFLTNNRVLSSPSIVYYTNKFDNVINTIYIGSQDNHLYALDLDTGSLEWSFDVGADIWGTPAISDDRSIYVAGADAMGDAHYVNLFALNPNGTIKWKHEMLRGAYASPILFSGTITNQTVGMVLIGSYDNNLYNLSYSGYESWAFPTPSTSGVRPADILSSPAIGSSGIIYFGSENHYIFAIEQEKGKIRWSYKTEGPVYSSPVIDNNVLYVGSFDHYLYAIRTNDETLSTSSPWPVYHQNPAHHSCITIYEETMPPTIQKTYPAHNETGLAANVPITLSVIFSTVMYTSTIDISFESALESDVLPSNKITFETPFIDDRQVTVASFQPLSSTLEPDTRYKIKISSTAVDMKRNKIQGSWTWVFYSETSDDNGDSSNVRGCFIDSVLLNNCGYHDGWSHFFQCQQSRFQLPNSFDVHSSR